MDDSAVTRSSASGQQMTNQNNSTSPSRSGLSVLDHSDIQQQTTANLSNRELISLTHLRPGPRPQNEYVDSSLSSSKLPPSSSSSTVTVVKPLQSKKLQTESHLPPPPHRFSNSSLTIATHSSPILTLGHERNRSGPGITSTVNVINTGATTGSSSLDSNSSIGICSDGGGIFGGAISSARRSRSAVISNQPITSQTLKKSTNAPEVLEGRGGSAHRDSVICGKCGKCKCRACREPRELPSWWFCGNKLEISAKSAMNICTCMCCVKGVFYHYSKGYQQDSVEGMCSDDPCAGCESPHCMKRWACMALLSLCLPCLCIYWPAKCALVCCTACYNGCSSRGCQCATGTNRTTSTSQTRRLIESDGSSA